MSDQIWPHGFEIEEVKNNHTDVVLLYNCCLFREAKEKTHDDSAAADPCVLVSHKEPTAAPSQLIPLVRTHTH